MTVVNVSALTPWDLTLVFDGKNYATIRPTWRKVIGLGELEGMLKGKASEDLEKNLREAIKGFFPAEIHAVFDKIEYDDLVAAFTACSEYFTDWLKKKQQAAAEAATGRKAPASGK